MKVRAYAVDAALVIALASAGVAASVANVALEREQPRSVAQGDVGPLPNGRALRVLSLGFERLVADLFWLRTVYYIGDDAAHDAGYPAAGRLARLVTDIDPNFTTVYVAMNSVLTTLRHSADDAIELLDKALTHDPTYWRLYFLQGFNYFYEKQDYARAARLMREAYRRGGPPYLQLLATRLYVEAGSPETAIAFVHARLREEQNEEAREVLTERLRSLLIARDLKGIDAAIERYAAAHGSAPTDPSELVRAGLLQVEPRDPDGNRYRIEEGRARSVSEHELLRIRRPGDDP